MLSRSRFAPTITNRSICRNPESPESLLNWYLDPSGAHLFVQGAIRIIEAWSSFTQSDYIGALCEEFLPYVGRFPPNQVSLVGCPVTSFLWCRRSAVAQESAVCFRSRSFPRNTFLPKGPCTSIVYMWALKGFQYPRFGAYVCTI